MAFEMLNENKYHKIWDCILSLVTQEDLSLLELRKGDNLRMSLAALFVHVATIDDDFCEAEYQEIKHTLSVEFDLPDETVNTLIKKAIEKDEQAVDLYGFVRTINKSFNYEGRLKIVKMFWDIVLADHKIKEVEEKLMGKLCHLLGVSVEDKLLLKKEAWEDIA